jgi:pheromone shutdown protein TraB
MSSPLSDAPDVETLDSVDSNKENKQPYTISTLEGPQNGKVYVIGTAHFSVASQKEVAELIRRVKPNYVVLELCSSRIDLLKLDEETVLREAKDLNMNKIIQLIKKVNCLLFLKNLQFKLLLNDK